MLNSRLIAWPLHLLECCVVTDGGGALILTTADRARDFPVNSSGVVSYTDTRMYGMFALPESVRQLRGEAEAQLPNVKVSIAHGPGGMFSAAGTVIMTNQD